MKTIRKKTVSLVLAALMLISAMPFAAFADEEETETPVDTSLAEEVQTYDESGTVNDQVALQEMVINVQATVVVTGAGTGAFESTKKCTIKSPYDSTADANNSYKIAKAAIKAVGLPYYDQYEVVSAELTDGIFSVTVTPITDSTGTHKCTSKTIKAVSVDDDSHKYVCQVCGDETVEQHDYRVSSKNTDYHTVKCAKCGHEEKVLHVSNSDSMKALVESILPSVAVNTVMDDGGESFKVIAAARDATCKKVAAHAKIQFNCGITAGGDEYGPLADHVYDSSDKCINCGKAKDDETEYDVNIYLTRERSTPLVSGTAKLTKTDMNNLKTNADGAASVLAKTKGTTSNDQDIIDAYRKSMKDYYATMDVVGSVNIYVSEDISKTIGDPNAKVEITIVGALVSNEDGYLVEDETGYSRNLYLGKSYFDQVKLSDPTGKRTLVNLKITKDDGTTRIISKSNTTAAIKVQSDDVECRAIWSAKSVTVKFYRHPGSSDLLATRTMRAGELIDDLPKLDGETVTWYLEDNTMLQEGKVYYDFSKDVLKAYPNSNNDVYLFIYKNGDTNTPVDSNPTVVTSKVQPNSGVIDRSELTSIIEGVVRQKNLKIVGLFDGKGWTEYTTTKSTKYASSAVYVGNSSEREGPQFLYVMVNPDGGSNSGSKADSSNPKTGDNAMLGTATVVMTAAVLGLGVTAVVRKKKEI